MYSINSSFSVVGAAVPSFAKVILAIICFVGCGVQIFGFLGVFKVRSLLTFLGGDGS